MSAQRALAIVAGAGPGTGAAVARAFAQKGFAVALVSRTASKLADLEADIKAKGGVAASFPTDISQGFALSDTFTAIKKGFPDSPLKVAVFNINSKWTVKPFLELTSDEYKGAVHTHIDAAFEFSQLAIKELEQANGGTLIFTGATAAMRGSAKFAALASGCFAVRALSQSLAREFHPKGIHVAHAIIDGVIDTKRAQSIAGGTGTAENFERLSPDEIAKAYVYLHEQAPSVWTQEIDLRPAKEKF